MRVALCLSGFPRIYKETFPYLKKYILDDLEPDIFYFGYSNEAKGISEEDILNTYNPKRYKIREYTEVVQDEIWRAYGATSINRVRLAKGKPIDILSQYYNMLGCNNLRVLEEMSKGEYDLVIRARTDYFFCRSIIEIGIKPETVYIPNVWNFGGVSSGFAFGDSSSMSSYSEFFQHIRKYNSEEGAKFHPETLKAHHLKNMGLKVENVKPHYWWKVQDFICNGYKDSIIDSQDLRTNIERSSYD